MLLQITFIKLENNYNEKLNPNKGSDTVINIHSLEDKDFDDEVEAVSDPEIYAGEEQEKEIGPSKGQHEEPDLLMDDIIVVATASNIDGVEDYGVEEVDVMEEESEDIQVVCGIVNEKEELLKYEYDQDSIPDLENHLDEDPSWNKDDSSIESICVLVQKQETFVEHV